MWPKVIAGEADVARNVRKILFFQIFLFAQGTLQKSGVLKETRLNNT
jgi:hypothetical protein